MMKQHSSLCAAALVCGLTLGSTAFAAPVEKGSSVRQAGDSEGVNFEVYLPLRNADRLDALDPGSRRPRSHPSITNG